MTGKQRRAYLKRIGYEGPEELSAKLLSDLQEKHFYAVPYENLDILAGKRLSYDEDALIEKIVGKRRGGYCFELNAAFAFLLEAMGFSVTHYFARFLLNEPTIPKRRHRVLRVRLPDGDYIADVGVGVSVPLRCVRLVQGEAQEQPCGVYRFRRDGFLGWVLEQYHKEAWRDLYSFTEEAQLPQDFFTTSYFCEKAPESIFNKDIKMARFTPGGGRVTLDGGLFKRFHGELVDTRTLSSRDDLRRTLLAEFGIALEDDVEKAVWQTVAP